MPLVLSKKINIIMIIKDVTNRGQGYSLIAALLCLLFVFNQPAAISSEISAEAQNLIYSCPMHPEETSAEPGKCSICGMFLVAEEEQDDHDISEHDMEHEMAPMLKNGKPALFWENRDSQAIVSKQHKHSSDHENSPVTQRLRPSILSGESAPEDQNLQQSSVERNEKHSEKGQSTIYICPMHPQIKQHEPGGSCPICGMDLVAKENTVPAGDSPQVFLEAAVIQNMGVRTTKAERKILHKLIHTQGLVTADDDRLISVHPRTGGWIEKLQVLTEGDRVERKDILVYFYSPWINQAQLKYIEALGELDQTSFEPSKKTEVAAKVDARRNSLRLLKVMDMDIMRIKNSRKVQNTIQLLAPQGGVITELNVSEGNYIEPYQSMFTIVDLSRVWVMVDIYEHQAPWVRKGNTVEITAPAIPARSWSGVVDYIYPTVDLKTRTLRARIVVDNPDEALLLNMFVKIDITANTPKQAVLTVPREAVIITGERETVIKSLGNGHFQPVDVKTGMRGEGSVEILSGLQQGDDIVVSGQFLIDSESSLQASFLRMSE
ncbi:MAG: efflux RND transporter periplasmic adaptor subunit [Gammaproteobacteria bacterium]|nr:MAG: efflux RND transporter periplasmic adaptor subunit [Gammaproteobacteria bacterium]